MDPKSPPHTAPGAPPPQKISDLFVLNLVDGLKATVEGKEIRYRKVKLRETTVADERKAECAAERAVNVNGAWKLLISESTFKHVLNMLHIDYLQCDDQVLAGALIDLDLYDRLSPRDLKDIEERIFLITLASEVRYGNLSEDDFESITLGLARPGVQSPQPSGQAPDVGAHADHAGPGPAMLAVYAGNPAHGAPEGDPSANQ